MRRRTINAAAPGAGLAHAALALGAFAIGTAEFATMSFLPAFTASLGVDAPAGGHVVSAYALGVVVGAPLLAVFGAAWSGAACCCCCWRGSRWAIA